METTPRSDDERDALLADAHARYHCDPGNMLWASDCIWEGCLFWEIASFTEDHLRSAGYRKHPEPETTAEDLLDTRAGMALARGAWQEGASAMLRSTNEHTEGPWSAPENPYAAPLLAMIAQARVPVGEGEL